MQSCAVTMHSAPALGTVHMQHAPAQPMTLPQLVVHAEEPAGREDSWKRPRFRELFDGEFELVDGNGNALD